MIERTVARAGPAVVVVGGAALLVWRLHVASVDDPTRSVALALVLGGVLATSLLVPAPPGEGRSGATVLVVALAGGVAVALAAVLAGPRPPVPWAASALPLALLAAVAEEALFRRALYGRLRRHGPVVAVLVTALAFAALHLPAYGWVAFPLDLGAGILFGWQRHASGTWAVPAGTHALANVVAMIR